MLDSECPADSLCSTTVGEFSHICAVDAYCRINDGYSCQPQSRARASASPPPRRWTSARPSDTMGAVRVVSRSAPRLRRDGGVSFLVQRDRRERRHGEPVAGTAASATAAAVTWRRCAAVPPAARRRTRIAACAALQPTGPLSAGDYGWPVPAPSPSMAASPSNRQRHDHVDAAGGIARPGMTGVVGGIGFHVVAQNGTPASASSPSPA